MQMFHSHYYWISPRYFVHIRVLSQHDGMLSLSVVFQSWYLLENFGIQFLFTSSYEGHLLKEKKKQQTNPTKTKKPSKQTQK